MRLVEQARGGTDISSFPRHVGHIIYLVLAIGLAWLVGVWFGNAGSPYTGLVRSCADDAGADLALGGSMRLD